MAIIIGKRTNLDAPIKVESLNGVTFTSEAEAHQFVVRCAQNGQDLTLVGTISAKFIRADGNTIQLVGSIVDGAAVVTLAQDCYNVQGRFQLAIFNTVGDTKLCIYACVGTVQKAQSGSLIDGGDIIPDVEDLIADIRAARQSIPPTYDTLLASVAGTYSATKTYAVGDYVWYDGSLYKCTTAITTAEDWTSGHWAAAVFGDDVASLRIALYTKVSTDALNYGYLKSYNSASMWEQGNINSTTGANSRSTTELHAFAIRTKEYLDSNATNVIVKNASQNYRISVFKYDSSNVFVGYVNKQTTLEIDSQYKYRLVLFHYSSATLGSYIAVSPSEYNEIGIFSDWSTIVTDDELLPIIERVNNSIDKNAYKFGYANDSNNTDLWEQGNINGSTGANSASTAALHLYTIRTKGYIDSNIEKVLCLQGYFSVYTYSIDGTFEGYSPYVQEYSGFSSDKKYRLNYRTQPTTSGVVEITPEYANNIYFLSGSLVNSPYLKAVSWAKNVPNNWYQGLGNDYSLFGHTTSYDDFISAFTALCSNRNDVTITNIGASSDSKDIFCYEIVPTLYKGMTSFNRNNKPVKIIIVSGQHGFEKSSCYGLYYFVRDLLNSYLDDPVLTWIKSNVHLIIIPCANPYGFTNMVRKNANGVDLNRNWNPGFDETISPSSDYYGGASAFDQPETQAIKAVIDANTDAFYLIDFHTNGEYKVANWNIVNWNSFNVSVITDDYFVNAYRAAFIHVSQLTECFSSEYNLDSSGSAMGSITQNTQLSTISTYSRSLGIMSNTFEGMNGFPSDAEPYQPNEQKANSEMICNWIKTLLSIFSNVQT